MSEIKRRTVTTIETHDVWIIRRPAPEVPDETVTPTPLDMTQAAAVSPSFEDTSSETDKERQI